MSEAPERIGLISDGLGNWALAYGYEADNAVHYVLADRIEELEATGVANRVAIMRLEAKLAKAVEALERATQEHRIIAGMDLIAASATAYNAARDAEATLTELTEGKDEWKCPINYPGCTKNCGSYGCGN